jgi:hypothetical protein
MASARPRPAPALSPAASSPPRTAPAPPPAASRPPRATSPAARRSRTWRRSQCRSSRQP